MVFPAGTGSEFVISTPVSVALFRAVQRFDDSDCACAAIEHATSTRIPISEYLIGIASQEVCVHLLPRPAELSTIPTPHLLQQYK